MPKPPLANTKVAMDPKLLEAPIITNPTSSTSLELISQVKDQVKTNIHKEDYDVTEFYHTTGFSQWLARHQKFEHLTLLVICLNALWIWIDTDLNPGAMLIMSPPVFQIVEQLSAVISRSLANMKVAAMSNQKNEQLDTPIVSHHPSSTSLELITQVKDQVKTDITKEEYDVTKFYNKTGFSQWLARHPRFEHLTLLVIVFNAIWIWIDTDYNPGAMLITSPPVFQIAEHAFCCYFSYEWIIRFLAFRRKRDGLRDFWFVFDSLLVWTMILETWLMSAVFLAAFGNSSGGMGNASVLRMARLLRLDLNPGAMLITSPPVFQIGEQLFCCYFSYEWIIRFLSFRRKRDGLRDFWFVFDSLLVWTMILETWLMSAVFLAFLGDGGGGMGNASILRIARLLRLTRMARMARLLRALPELLILIKGMVVALRSVCFALGLLALILYVFGIAFTQLSEDTSLEEDWFSSVLHSMNTLLIYGALMDEISSLVIEIENESIALLLFFYVFILLAALTVLNMLIGVICEMVLKVGAS
eukprot:CAMPEP_0172782974 /NCGR_PEP_ID=MMETSP1074-20121228/204201_1 /TAXON_ID=2916 /ORGANISM="Ceratium fusus, Strain PA161109" /LENGTH=528 /DNA_ID=CAMNT_0013619961 /DNA_START=40 /DNA_END=1624 /DNA_ORIENTATION=-